MIPHARIRNELRRLWWRYSPERKDAKKRARLRRGIYLCDACGGLTGKIELDHLVPIGPTPGSKHAKSGTTWDTFIDRLFNGELQALCTTCHAKRTKEQVPCRAI